MLFCIKAKEKNVAITIKKTDIVKIKPEYQDKGDDLLTWIAIEDEDGGRVRIAPINTGLKFPPNQVVDTNMLELA